MLNIAFIREQVNRLVEEKKYDERAKALLTAFFTSFADNYDLSEEEFLINLEKYGNKVNKISFYNIGTDKYIYTRDNELVFDKDTAENLDEKNIERFLQTSIKGNMFALNENMYRSCVEMSEMASVVKLYEQPDSMSYNITSMIAAAFDLDKSQTITLHKDICDGENRSRKEGKVHEYNYYTTARILVNNINEKVKNILQGKDVKESYKALYGLCLLNFKIKTCDEGLITDETVSHYAQLLEQFQQYKDVLGIQDSELESISLDQNNWKINAKETIEKLGKTFPNAINLGKPKSEEQRKSRVDRQAIIEKQKKFSKKSFPSLMEIEQEVNRLIKEKEYPEEVRGILMEFFMRNSEEFEWDSETLDKKIENIRTNVNYFKYAPPSKIHGASGEYNGVDKCIYISGNIGKDKFKVATVTMHELTHAAALTLRQNTELEDNFSRKNTKYHNIAIGGLNELVTESSTIKTEGKNPYSDKYATRFKLKDGYSEFCGAMSMVAAAFGVSESEFLKYADKGADKCKDILETRYPGLNIGKKLDELNDELTYLHSAAVLRNAAADAYTRVYNILNNIYECRVAIDKKDPNFDSIRARYDEYKLNKNLLEAKRILGLPKKVLRKNIDNFDLVKEKAKIRPEEREVFEIFGRDMIDEIKIRDNSELLECGSSIIKYGQKFDTKEGFFKKILSRLNLKKLLPKPQNAPTALKSPARDSHILEEQDKWKKGIRFETKNMVAQNESKKTNKENPSIDEPMK